MSGIIWSKWNQMAGYLMQMMILGSLLTISNGLQKDNRKLCWRHRDHIGFFFGIAFLCLMFILRSPSVGKDTAFYLHAFQEIRDLPMERIFTSPIYPDESHTWTIHLEPGFLLINKLLGYLTEEGQFLILFIGLFLFLLLFLLLIKESPDPALSLWLYFTLGIYQSQMNTMRNALSILMGYLAIDEFRKRKRTAFILIMTTACFFHFSVILFLPVCLLTRLKINRKQITIILILSMAIGIVFSILCKPLAEWIPIYGRYLKRSGGKAEAAGVGFVHLGLIVIMISSMERERREKALRHFSLGLGMISADLILLICSLCFQAASRAAACFGAYVILLIPQLLQEVREDRRKIVMRRVILFSLGMYLFRITVNNIGGSMPYCFFFQSNGGLV